MLWYNHDMNDNSRYKGGEISTFAQGFPKFEDAVDRANIATRHRLLIQYARVGFKMGRSYQCIARIDLGNEENIRVFFDVPFEYVRMANIEQLPGYVLQFLREALQNALSQTEDT